MSRSTKSAAIPAGKPLIIFAFAAARKTNSPLRTSSPAAPPMHPTEHQPKLADTAASHAAIGAAGIAVLDTNVVLDWLVVSG
jgi:hypothetical protein